MASQVYSPSEAEIAERAWAMRYRDPDDPKFPGNNCDEAGYRQRAIQELINDEKVFQDILRVERRGY